MFDYSHLEALLAIEREGSIDGAARSLGISAPAISQRIKVLEERVGAITVVRKKPARTTDFGSILCRHIEQVMLLENQLFEENTKLFSRMDKEVQVIGIAMDYASLGTWFAEAMKIETQRNSSILFDIRVIENSEVAGLMMQGQALAAVSDRKETIQGYRSLSLGSQSYVAVMTPKYRDLYLAGGVDAKVIQDCATIRRTPNDVMYQEWLSENFGFALELKNHIIPSAGGVLSAVLRSVAWAILPYYQAKPHLDAGELIEVIPGSTLRRPLFWHYSRAIADALKPLNQSVLKAATDLLCQDSVKEHRMKAAPVDIRQ